MSTAPGPETAGPVPVNNPLAVTSLVLGILSYLVLPVIGALGAIVTGHIARSQIRRSAGSQSGDGMAVAGLILGYAHFVLACLAIAVAMLFFGSILALIHSASGETPNDSPFALCTVMDRAELKAAIDKGFDVNAGCCAEHMFGECSFPKPNSNALVFAAEAGNLEAVQALLDQGADVNKASDLGDALTMAGWRGFDSMVDPLLSHGASARSKMSATRIAAHEGHGDIAIKVLGHIGPKDLPEACKELFCGLAADLQQAPSPKLAPQREVFLHAVQTCPDPNIVCEPFRLLSHITGNDENAPLVQALLEKGADLEAKESGGKTVREFVRSHNDYASRPKIRALIEGH